MMKKEKKREKEFASSRLKHETVKCEEEEEGTEDKIGERKMREKRNCLPQW